jgi:hypothetical protein
VMAVNISLRPNRGRRGPPSDDESDNNSDNDSDEEQPSVGRHGGDLGQQTLLGGRGPPKNRRKIRPASPQSPSRERPS